jgi:DNA-binding MarR family transcriptional regulator
MKQVRTEVPSPKRGSAIANHELHEHRILDHLQTGERVTQRKLSRELGIALGLTNLLVRRLVTKGWVRITRISRSRILYLITPAGIAAKARLTRAYVRESVRFYRETRNRIQAQFENLSAVLPGNENPTPIVFYGAGDVAEIAYVCLQDTQLELVALVDPTCMKPFFNTPVFRPTDLRGATVCGRPFTLLIVMPLENEDEVREVLERHEVSMDTVFWL